MCPAVPRISAPPAIRSSPGEWLANAISRSRSSNAKEAARRALDAAHAPRSTSEARTLPEGSPGEACARTVAGRTDSNKTNQVDRKRIKSGHLHSKYVECTTRSEEHTS